MSGNCYIVTHKEYKSAPINLANFNKGFIRLLLRPPLLAKLVFTALFYRYCLYRISDKPFSYKDHVVARVFKPKQDIYLESRLENNSLPKLFLSESNLWEEKFCKVEMVEDQLEEVKAEIETLSYSFYSEKLSKRAKRSLATKLRLLKTNVPKLEERITKGKDEVSKLSYYRFDYLPFPGYVYDELTLYLQNTDFFLNTDQPTLKHLTKQIGFDLPIVVERSLLDDDGFIKETPTPQALINKVLLLASELMQTITLTDKSNNASWTNGKKIKLYRFQFQFPSGNNQPSHVYAQAFYYPDFKGKKWIVVTSQFISAKDFFPFASRSY